MDNRLRLENITSNNLQRALRETLVEHDNKSLQELYDYAIYTLNISNHEYEFATRMAIVASG